MSGTYQSALNASKRVENTKISINKLGKANVNPTKGPTGAHWESLISFAYNLRKKGVSKYNKKPPPPIPEDWGSTRFRTI